MAMDTPVDLEI